MDFAFLYAGDSKLGRWVIFKNNDNGVRKTCAAIMLFLNVSRNLTSGGWLPVFIANLLYADNGMCFSMNNEQKI